MTLDVTKRLYVKCPNCNLIFPSGFRASSPVQLIAFSYLCPKCRMIVRRNPPDYLEKEGEEFRKALKNDEVFARPPDQRIEILGPDLFLFDKEVVVKPGALLTCDRGIVSYQERAE